MVGRTVLSLCDRTGTWSDPYRQAGYEVIQVDLSQGDDVRLMKRIDMPVHGILMAPPCTHFAGSGARWWKEKGTACILDGMAVVDACLRTVAIYHPEWWVLENPVGRLRDYLGEPAFKFDPCDYGDPYTKRTCLWGNFTPPVGMFCPSTSPVKAALGSMMHKMPSSSPRRSVTPAGFALAFFEANP